MDRSGIAKRDILRLVFTGSALPSCPEQALLIPGEAGRFRGRGVWGEGGASPLPGYIVIERPAISPAYSQVKRTARGKKSSGKAQTAPTALIKRKAHPRERVGAESRSAIFCG